MRRKTVITREFYETLVAIFREVGNNRAEVARRALCSDETAARGYDIGWPRLGFPPIRDRAHTDAIDAQRIARESAARIAEIAAAEAEKTRREHIKCMVIVYSH